MSKHRITCIAIAMGYFIFLSACSKKQAEELKPVTPGAPGAQVTYTGFVGPLFQAKCASCHAPGNAQASIFTFNGYSSVTLNAARIKTQVLVQKSMPIGTSISAADLQSLQDWFDQGMPQ